MVKLGRVELGGKSYPVTFGARAFELAQKRTKGMKAFMKDMDNQEMESVFDLFYACIAGGCEYVNEFHLHPDGIELDENGKIFPPTRKQFSLLLDDFDEIQAMSEEIMRVAKEHKQKKINAVPVQHKGKKKRQSNR